MLNHVLPNLGFGVLNALSLEVAHQHGTVVEALLVRKLLGLGELLDVLLGVDFEFLDEEGGGHVAVRRGREDGNGVEGGPFGVNFVVFGLFAEVGESGEVIRGVGGDRGHDTGTLEHNRQVFVIC